VHCKRYYPLDIAYFKSSLDAGLLDLLWAKYWVNTLASSPLLATRDLTAGQIRDIGARPPARPARPPCPACIHAWLLVTHGGVVCCSLRWLLSP
jgi:hypothetical protein